MSQISPPIRIVLVVAVAFMAAWFVFLRPGGETAAPPAPAPASGLGNAVDGANQAAATANAGAASASGQTADPAAAPATQTGGATAPAGSKPAATQAAKGDAELGLPTSVAKAVAKKKTLVMLFWNKRAYDDQAVRRELRGIDRHHGKVKVHVASINDVARYAPITRGVNLEQSPTIVVAKGTTADALVGYVDRGTIDQTVSDLLRTKSPR